MNKLLYITANPKEENKSYSLQVGRAFIKEYKKQHPKDEILEIDVFNANIPLIDKDILNAWDKLQSGKNFDELISTEKEKVIRFNNFTEQFLSADKYVFVTPLWNFTIPPMMKAYLDTACVAGKTFKYTANGPVGLLENKKALHIQASGGVYSSGPSAAFEHGNSYIKNICQFIGIQGLESLLIEGMAQDPSKAEVTKKQAIEKAEVMAKSF